MDGPIYTQRQQLRFFIFPQQPTRQCSAIASFKLQTTTLILTIFFSHKNVRFCINIKCLHEKTSSSRKFLCEYRVFHTIVFPFYRVFHKIIGQKFEKLRPISDEFDLSLLKFIYSEKATKFCEISTLDLSYVMVSKSRKQIMTLQILPKSEQNVKSTVEWLSQNIRTLV